MSSQESDQISKKMNYIIIFLLYAAPIVSGVFHVLLKQPGNFKVLLSNTIITVFTASIFYTFLHVRQNFYYGKIQHKGLFLGAYVLAFFLLAATDIVPLGVFWLVVVAVTALDCGLELAFANYVYLMLQYMVMILSEDQNIYRFLQYILIGLVVTLLFSQLENKKAFPYLAIILAASDAVLQFAVHQFDISKLKTFALEGCIEIISVLLLVLVGFLYLQFIRPDDDAIKLKLMCLIEPDYELLLRLENYSMPLLVHSMKISQLSEGAAAAVGGDALLAKAGGLYHEIGRIEDESNYIEAGNKLGQSYNFPNSLLDVMRQHSTGFESPKSIEAAIVMLSDCIVSTSEYLTKTGKRKVISDEKLVQSIFQNRLEKGNLDEAKISQEQIAILKEYYIKNAFANE